MKKFCWAFQMDLSGFMPWLIPPRSFTNELSKNYLNAYKKVQIESKLNQYKFLI